MHLQLAMHDSLAMGTRLVHSMLQIMSIKNSLMPKKWHTLHDNEIMHCDSHTTPMFVEILSLKF